jgi:hypothetical protein
VIVSTGAAEKSAVATVYRGPSVQYAGTAKETGIVAEFGKTRNHPVVSSTVFEAHDTIPDWLGIAEKLDGFSALEKGWDGYKAAPPAAVPLEFAKAFLDLLRRNRSLPSRVAPSVVGGVGLTFRKERRKVYVEFSNKGTVHALFSDGESEPVVQKVAPDLAGYRALFAKMRAYLDE